MLLTGSKSYVLSNLRFSHLIHPTIINLPSPAADDIQKVTSDLEEQFTQGMEHRISGKARSHTGLGFVAPKLNTVVNEPSSVGDTARETGVDGSEEAKLKV